MGYTHYYEPLGPLDAETFKLWSADVRTILANLPEYTTTAGGYYQDYPLVVGDGMGDGGTPEVTDTRVSFNGVAHSKISELGLYGIGKKAADRFGITRRKGDGARRVETDLSHETFYLEAGDKEWAFCKTAHKPYDLAVTAALIRLAYHYPEGVRISSDGDVSDWEEGRLLCERLFGYAVVPFQDEVAAVVGGE